MWVPNGARKIENLRRAFKERGEFLSKTCNPRPDFQDLISKSTEKMGNIETTFTLQCSGNYKVIAKFDTPISTGRGNGIKCTMAYLYKDFDYTNVTDIWHKEVHDDGAFSLYVKDAEGKKWYINEYTEALDYTYWGCFTEDVISPPRRFTVEDGKITIQYAPKRFHIGMAKWYMGFKVIDCLRTDDLFVDPDNGKDYYAFPIIEDKSTPIELVETTVCRRFPLIKYYFLS
jgi:hypothetical protein